MSMPSTNTELLSNTVAADGTGQGASCTGGKVDTKETNRPCHVYIATLRGIGQAYFQLTRC
jgi:hypothetical protein